MAKKANWFCWIDGEEVGPVRSGNIKKLISSGALRLTDEIRKEGGDWREVSEFPKLVEIVETVEAGSKADGSEKRKPGSVSRFSVANLTTAASKVRQQIMVLLEFFEAFTHTPLRH